jgi:hypothetical protein
MGWDNHGVKCEAAAFSQQPSCLVTGVTTMSSAPLVSKRQHSLPRADVAEAAGEQLTRLGATTAA